MILIKELEGMVSKVWRSNIFKRFITSLVLAPTLIYVILQGSFLFDLFLGIVCIISLYEIIMIVKYNRYFSLFYSIVWILATSLYIGGSLISLKYIRSYDQGYMIIMLFLSIWTFDSSAYFIGSLIGGPKLLKKISPKKTWSGFIAGTLCTVFMSIFTMVLLLHHPLISLNTMRVGILFGGIGIIGQIGDLIESYFKRSFHVKNSGFILPGHGGVLDRLDSMFLSSIILYILLTFKVLSI